LEEETVLGTMAARAWAVARATAARACARPGIRTAVADVAWALLITRLVTITVGLFASVLVPLSRRKQFELPFAWEHLARVFAAWDSGWYFDIAQRGYYFLPDGQSSIAFFPLYPMLVRIVAWPFGATDRALWTSAIVLPFVETFGALLVLHRFSERLLGSREHARRTVLYVCVFPFSLFLTKAYAEATFLLFSVLAVSQAYASRWRIAGLAGGLAALARPNGMLVGLPLLILALRDRPTLPTLARRGLALALVPGTVAAFSLYAWVLSGDPLAWLTAQAEWGFTVGHPPWQQLLKMLDRLEEHGFYGYFFVSELAPYRLLHGAAALTFLALTPFVFARLGLALGVYVLASLLVPLSGNALEGVGRYAAVLFPVFMTMAHASTPRSHEITLVVSSLFLGLLVVLFVALHPIY
jgi:hypothetical protein